MISSSATSPASSAVAILSTPLTLRRLNNGEYTAASVLAAPVQAVRHGLVREEDGNYGIDKVAPAFNTAPARTSSGLQDALASLRLGG